ESIGKIRLDMVCLRLLLCYTLVSFASESLSHPTMADRVETTPAPNSSILATRVDPTSSRYEANMRFMADLMSQVHNEEEKIREGGGPKAIEAQHSKGRLTARERIGLLADPGTFFELGIYAASGMYAEWGGASAAGVISGVARVERRL